VYLLGVPKNGRNVVASKTAALAFISANMAAAFSNATDIAPVRRDLLNDSQNNPRIDLAYEEAFIAKGWLSPQPSQVDAVFSAMVDDVVSGRSDAEEALLKAARSLK
jgi:ABC-type glycerol-3-phosphate transport system substrate-binding protein